MNLLPLANVVAAGFEWDYLWHWTHDQEIGKVLIAPSATVIAALIAIIGVWLTARRATQQMELTKQGTPPELTRYKEWLEVSEKYKEVVGPTGAHRSAKELKEYKEIESSRKAALDRAVWERKVISACPDVNGQKRLMGIPISFMMSDVKKNNFPKNIPNFKLGKIFLVEIMIILPIALFLILVSIYLVWFSIIYPLIYNAFTTFIGPVDSTFIWVAGNSSPNIWETIGVIVFLMVILGLVNLMINVGDSWRMSVSGEKFAECGYLRILRENMPNDEFLGVFMSSLNGVNNSQRCFFALWDENYRNFIYYPKWFESKFSFILEPIIFGLPYGLINIRHKSRGHSYGEYKPEVFDLLKEDIDKKKEGIDKKKEDAKKMKKDIKKRRRMSKKKAKQDENLKGKKTPVSRRMALWISKRWESLNRS